MVGERHADLGSCHGAAHERHGPPRLKEQRSFRRVRVARDEPPGGEALQCEGQLVRAVSVRVAEGEAVEHAGAVGVDLQAPEAPQASVAEGAVVEIHRVLRGDDYTDAERAGLFHEGDERSFRRLIGGVGR